MTIVNGITFQIEGEDTPAGCCRGQRTDLSRMQGALDQAHRWTDVVGDHGSVLAFAVLSVVVVTLFALKHMRRPARHVPERGLPSPAVFKRADLDASSAEEAARSAFLRRYGGTGPRPAEPRGGGA